MRRRTMVMIMMTTMTDGYDNCYESKNAGASDQVDHDDWDCLLEGG